MRMNIEIQAFYGDPNSFLGGEVEVKIDGQEPVRAFMFTKRVDTSGGYCQNQRYIIQDANAATKEEIQVREYLKSTI